MRGNVFVGVVATALCSLSIAAERCPLPQHPVTSNDEAVALAKRVIPVYRLTDISLACLEVKPFEKYAGTGYELDVREIHTKECGVASALFSPRLMSIHIEPDGTVTTTAATMNGDMDYRPPVCKPVSKRTKKPGRH